MRLVIDGQRLTAGRTGVGRCLESLLAEYFQLPIVIEQMQGQWLNLEPDDFATMPSKENQSWR